MNSILLKPYAIASLIGAIIFSFNFIDLPLAQWVQQHQSMLPLPAIKTFSLLGKAVYPLSALFLLAIVARWRSINSLYQMAVVGIMAIIVAGITCDIAKVILGRARPIAFFTEQHFGFMWLQIHAKYWSFPSGHTTTTFAVVTVMTHYFRKWRWLLLIVAVSIAISRITLNKHYLSDVMMGAYLGTVMSLVVFYILENTTLGVRISDKFKLVSN